MCRARPLSYSPLESVNLSLEWRNVIEASHASAENDADSEFSDQVAPVEGQRAEGCLATLTHGRDVEVFWRCRACVQTWSKHLVDSGNVSLPGQLDQY